MPSAYLRGLTAPSRTPRADLHLGVLLAFIAGATNAGGFLVVGQYTSHMTGMLSRFADELALTHVTEAAYAALSVALFVLGAIASNVLVQLGRRSRLTSEYAPPLLAEAGLLLLFGLGGATGAPQLPIVLLLCFLMGLQNAIITKISQAVIRTTHVTGLLTDLGIELGRELMAALIGPGFSTIAPDENRRRLVIHSALILAFSSGALFGAVAFSLVGFSAMLPMACTLGLVSVAPFVRPRPQG